MPSRVSRESSPVVLLPSARGGGGIVSTIGVLGRGIIVVWICAITTSYASRNGGKSRRRDFLDIDSQKT